MPGDVWPRRFWTDLLLASRLALAPSRVALAFGALLLIGLLAHVPDLWFRGSGPVDTPARMLSDWPRPPSKRCGLQQSRPREERLLGIGSWG